MNKKCKFYRGASCGFTLVELMVTVAIAAILLGIGVPSFTSLLSSNNADSAVRRLSNSLNYARAEAVSRFTNVTVCVSADEATCANNIPWSSVWIIRTNTEVLRVEDISSLLVTFNGQNTADSSVVRSVCFDNQGLECNGLNVTFTAQVPDGDDAELSLNARGATNLD